MSNIRTLVLDIETSPALAYTFTLRKAFIAPTQVVENTRTLCWAAQWVGESEVMFGSEWDGGLYYIHSLWDLLDEADAIVSYNGKTFDVPHINREFIERGLNPPSPYAHIDLYQTVRTKFRFMQSGLNNVCSVLDLGGKAAHEGFALWTSVMAGDEKAQARMERYNKQDVRLTTRLYKELRPWIANHPNEGLFTDKPHVCPTCGGKSLQKRGVKRTAVSAFQVYQCNTCGSYSRSGKRLKGVDLRPV